MSEEGKAGREGRNEGVRNEGRRGGSGSDPYSLTPSLPSPSPGQIAYHAWCQSIYSNQAHPADYLSLAPGARAAWEAVACAVLDAWQAQPRIETAKTRPTARLTAHRPPYEEETR